MSVVATAVGICPSSNNTATASGFAPGAGTTALILFAGHATDTIDFNTPTYHGEAFSVLEAETDIPSGSAAIYYFVDPLGHASSGDVVITTSGNTRIAFVVFSVNDAGTVSALLPHSLASYSGDAGDTTRSLSGTVVGDTVLMCQYHRTDVVNANITATAGESNHTYDETYSYSHIFAGSWAGTADHTHAGYSWSSGDTSTAGYVQLMVAVQDEAGATIVATSDPLASVGAAESCLPVIRISAREDA